MITLTKTKEFITGTVNGETFGINYNEEVYKKLQDLETAFDNSATVEEAKAVCEEFTALMSEDSSAKHKSDIPGLVKGNDGYHYAEVNGKVIDIPVPSALVDRMRDSLDKDIDNTPLFKFWFRFLRNEKFRKLWLSGDKQEAIMFSERLATYIDADYINEELVEKLMEEKGYSEEVAEQLATTKETKITKEGLICSYKVSKEITQKWEFDKDGNKVQVDMYPVSKVIDPITGLVTYGDMDKGHNEDRWFKPAVMGDGGEEFYCGDKLGHVIKVGQVHKLQNGWDSINSNDNQSCTKGLHVGNITYIKGYQGCGTETHNTLIDPMHVGACPLDQTGAIRVLQYFTLDAFSGINKSIYHSSKYASITDAQFTEMKEEIAAAYDAKEAKADLDMQILSVI